MNSAARAAGAAVVVAVITALLGVAAGPAQAAGTVSVSGVVIGPDGQPAEGATIELIPDADVDSCPDIPEVLGHYGYVLATTDEQGRFSFTCTADLIWVVARLSTGETARSQLFASGPPVEDYEFRVYATKGSITGTIYDTDGAPVPHADYTFIWDSPGAGAYDYRKADADGRYRVTGLDPGVTYTIVGPEESDNEDYTFVATEGELVHDIGSPGSVSPDEVAPRGAFTKAYGTGGRLKLGGWARDNAGVANVLVAIRDRATGKWLRLDGSWGAFQRHRTTVTKPGAARTGWWFNRRLPDGSYGVSLVVKDTSGNSNPTPRPWGKVEVTR